MFESKLLKTDQEEEALKQQIHWIRAEARKNQLNRKSVGKVSKTELICLLFQIKRLNSSDGVNFISFYFIEAKLKMKKIMIVIVKP